ncbi:hypothetical protein D9757_002391 [Collybiopsis confluens]|uniref:F-box domain-containing protein n=1 Tax=Collybiopsis confluens TaxID=2823264 RepID=A0A8H5HYB0_9AGAR|nr:hypothetical protein D9757_002391 [Collybiopsis confluens]
MQATLPLELQELIIDLLRFCSADLKVCSLVCRAWLPRSRAFLFRVIALPVIPLNPNCGHCSWSRFGICSAALRQRIYWTLSTVPAPSVRGVILSCEPPTNSAKCLQLLQSGRHTIQPAITQGLLRGLRLLHINGQGSCTGESFSDLLQEIDCLEYLIIEGQWSFSFGNTFRSLAIHAPNLKALSLAKLRWLPSTEDLHGRRHVQLVEKRVLRLERLCIWKPVKHHIDLATKLILPSPCLDLSQLRYLAMPASRLHLMLNDTRLKPLGREVTHLAITNFDAPAVQLNKETFPSLSHLQVFVRDEWTLLQILDSIECPTALVHLQVNFGITYPNPPKTQRITLLLQK